MHTQHTQRKQHMGRKQTQGKTRTGTKKCTKERRTQHTAHTEAQEKKEQEGNKPAHKCSSTKREMQQPPQSGKKHKEEDTKHMTPVQSVTWFNV